MALKGLRKLDKFYFIVSSYSFHDLSLILEMVKHREERKKNLLQTTIKVLETRFVI